MFKIKNEEGLFSDGKQSPKFVPKGKTWTTSQAVKLHIINVFKNFLYKKTEKGYYKDEEFKNPYEFCDVIEYSLVEKNTIPCIEEMIGYEQRKIENLEKNARKRAKYEKT